MEGFVTKHVPVVIGLLSGFDRLVFRGTLRFLGHPKGMTGYLYKMNVPLKDFATFADGVTERLKDASQALAQRTGRPVR